MRHIAMKIIEERNYKIIKIINLTFSSKWKKKNKTFQSLRFSLLFRSIQGTSFLFIRLFQIFFETRREKFSNCTGQRAIRWHWPHDHGSRWWIAKERERDKARKSVLGIVDFDCSLSLFLSLNEMMKSFVNCIKKKNDQNKIETKTECVCVVDKNVVFVFSHMQLALFQV